MSDKTLGEITACLWDLRTQCEEQIRALTDAQRLTDDFRLMRANHDLLRRRLRVDLQGVLRANTVIREAAQDCIGLIEKLPTDVGPTSQ